MDINYTEMAKTFRKAHNSKVNRYEQICDNARNYKLKTEDQNLRDEDCKLLLEYYGMQNITQKAEFSYKFLCELQSLQFNHYAHRFFSVIIVHFSIRIFWQKMIMRGEEGMDAVLSPHDGINRINKRVTNSFRPTCNFLVSSSLAQLYGITCIAKNIIINHGIYEIQTIKYQNGIEIGKRNDPISTQERYACMFHITNL